MRSRGDEERVEAARRIGEARLRSGETLKKLDMPFCKKLEPIECQCLLCGGTMLADRWQAGENIRTLSTCPACLEKADEIQRQKAGAEYMEEIANRREGYREKCGILPKFQPVRFESYKTEGLAIQLVKALKKARDYADSFPVETVGVGYKSLVLFSESSWGVGKTHLACSIGHRVLDLWQGKPGLCPVRFISEPQLFMDITGTYNYSQDERATKPSETDIIRRMITVPLLILDDVGKRKPADPRFVQRVLFSIIDGRYNYNRPIVMTANLNPEGLARYLGGGDSDEAILDRLIGMCGGGFTRMDGQSKRRLAK